MGSFERIFHITWIVVIIIIIMTIAQGDSFRVRQRHPVLKSDRTGMRQMKLTLLRSSQDAAVSETNSQLTIDNMQSLIYSPWSEWSSCSRKCKQERSRQCTAPWRCGNVVTKEERSCTGRRCKRQPFTIVDDDPRCRKGLSYGDVKFDPDILQDMTDFSTWSEWSPCTKRCRTRRYSTCKMETSCGSSVIQEDAYCYVKGTICERMYRRRKKVQVAPNELKEQQLQNDGSSHSHVFEECGVANVSSDLALRIIGGQPVGKGRWPWQTAILNRHKDAFCGGTLIAPQWVVTAAHCVRKRLYVRLGEHNLENKEGTEQEYRVVQVFMHPEYDPETVDNDIALLKLSSPAVLDKHVQLACLPKQNAPLPQDKLCTILGWGKENHMATHGTEVLKEAKVPIVDIKNCLGVYEDYYITGNMFCAGYRRGRVDSCAGDSGGPLLCEANNRWHIYGITSFGEGCGRKGKYGIYAKVPNYITWIETTMAENFDVL